MTHKKTFSGWEENARERYYHEDEMKDSDNFDNWEDQDYNEEQELKDEKNNNK